MASSLKPMGDRVVVKPKGREETTKSGIVPSVPGWNVRW